MKIKAEVRKILTDSNVKAVFTLAFDNVFVVKSVRLIDGKNGLFIAMPSIKGRDGEFRDMCFPITDTFHKKIQKEVETAYSLALAEQNKPEEDIISDGDTDTDIGDNE